MNTDLLLFITHHWILFATLGIVIILLIWQESRGKISGFKLSLSDVTTLINRQHAVLLDLRDSAAFKGGHINRALNFPQTDLFNQLDKLKKYREKPVILIDQVGDKAHGVCEKLRQKGFTQIYTLAGGLQTWTTAGLPLIKELK